MKLNNFRGELTDISAKKEALTCSADCWAGVTSYRKIHVLCVNARQLASTQNASQNNEPSVQDVTWTTIHGSVTDVLYGHVPYNRLTFK